MPDNLTLSKLALDFLSSSVLELCPFSSLYRHWRAWANSAMRRSHPPDLAAFLSIPWSQRKCLCQLSHHAICILCYTPSSFYFRFLFKSSCWGWGKGFVDKVLAMEVWEFRSSAPSYVLTYNSSFREAESGDSLKQSGLTLMCSGFSRKSCLSNKVESDGGRRHRKSDSCLYTPTSTHIWTHTHKHAHHTWCTHMQQRLNAIYRN